MARVLIATVSAAGHIAPGLGIARALVRRGHEVVWYTGRRYQRSVESTGARFAPMRAAREIDAGALDDEFPGRAELRGGLAQLKFDMLHLFIDPIPSHLEDLERIAAEQDFDGYISDVGLVAMSLFCEREGLRHTSYGISALPFPSRDAAPFGLALRPSQLSLAHGIPLVVAGGSEDKPEVAARIAWTGAGIDLRTATPSPERIREAVRTLLREPSYRDNARRLQTETASYDAPQRAIEAIERLLPTAAEARAASARERTDEALTFVEAIESLDDGSTRMAG